MPTVTAQASTDDSYPLPVAHQNPIIETSNSVANVIPFQFPDNLSSTTTAGGHYLTATKLTPAASSSAFQILNRDYLIGQYSKPNAIVRPMNFKQIESPNHNHPADKSTSNTTTTAHNLNLNQQFNDITSSAGTGTGTAGTAVLTGGGIDGRNSNSVSKKIYQQVNTFAKELDLKLRRLRSDKFSISSKNSSNQDSINKRPLFITTVPTGIFLPPVKLIPVNRVYAFSSRPKIFSIYRPSDYAARPTTTFYPNLKDTTATNNIRIRQSQNDLIHDKNFSKSTTTTTTLNGLRPLNNVSLNNRREPEPYKNVMYDRRVVRGSNFTQCQPATPWNPYFANAGLLSGKEQQPMHREVEARRRQTLRKKFSNRRNIIGSPPPVSGRQHEHIQTEKFLEEIFDRPPEFDVNTQTDLFLQRPPSPPYVPAKIGVDVSTTIEDGELFNFDSEVLPILETLVGHSVKQGLIEVLHEEEIADMKQQQEEFLALREADLAELRRLEAEELRLQAEKERRLRQDIISKELDTKMQERVTAAKLLQGHIANLLPEVMLSLEPLTAAARKEDMELTICPWLSKEISDEVGHIIDSREILAEIIKEIVIERAKVYANYCDESDIEECEEEDGSVLVESSTIISGDPRESIDESEV